MTRSRSFPATVLVIFFLSLTWSVPSITAFASLRATVTDRHWYDPVRVRLCPNPLPPPRAGSSALYALVSKQDTVNALSKVSIVATATMVTYCLHNQNRIARMTPVVASGLVALLSSILLPEKLALAALCGSFAGMAKMAVIPTLFSVQLLDSALLLGIVCAAMLGLFDKNGWLVGKGGRLGTIAQCACTLQFVALEFANNNLKWSAQKSATTAALADFSLYEHMLAREQLVTIMLFSVAGALFMRTYRHLSSKLSLKRLSHSVAAVGVTGVVGGYILSPIHAGAAFCGSFVSMSNSNTLPGTISLILASSLAGASQLGLAGVLLGGWGGKLGTAALFGVLTYQLSSRVIAAALLGKRRQKEN